MADNKAVEEFGNVLAQMSGLKAPGVSGSKIKLLTEISIDNVQTNVTMSPSQSESILIQKLYTHFKKTPGTHKLGVLYAVDSIVRAYIDEARKAGQDPTQDGPDGTFSAGVHRITGLLSSLMNDIMLHAPEDTKEKIKKLLDIWQRGSTFPADLIASIRSKHFSSPQQSPATDNAYGIPSLQFPGAAAAAQPTAQADVGGAAPNTAAILQALAQMAKGNTPTSSTPAAVPVSVSAAAPASQVPPQIPNLSHLANLSNPAPQSLPVSLPNFGGQPQPTVTASNLQSLLPSLLGGNFGAAAQQPAPPPQPQQQQSAFPNLGMPQGDQNVMTQLALLQMFSQGLNPSQLAQALEQATKQNGQAAYNQGGWQQPQGQPGPYDRYPDERRGPFSPGRDRFRRSRSRSPAYGDDGTVRRRSPVYGEYSGNLSGDARERDYNKRGRGGRGSGTTGRGNRRDRSPSPPRQDHWDNRSPPPGQKFVEYDESLKPDKIRVYSRTLFVGGVSSSEQDLRQLFAQHGDVQSCIVNFEKRHAFIKMKTRSDAVRAKDALETHRLPHSVLRTRWGVGFGPRDCCDYATGISEIALDRLTDADRRWLQTAEYGGIGDRPIEGGLVLEEPDIEIGQGVSSKAISRRMQTDHAGARGPKSSFQRHERGDNVNGFDKHRDYNNGPDRDVNSAPPPPSSTVPGFGGFGGPYMPLIYQQPGQQ
ncbi:hypothetical protein Dda_8464 [Drechslerella dactyloides]|uniref:RNA binding protein Nrd1 n=1 Tax=Drechslerella dactyloides TaxID=74499 RepID=A0AAD6NFU8_DREDA|nr:hypothetical protein Dda_8464 [Drechslerella dactyloides]